MGDATTFTENERVVEVLDLVSQGVGKAEIAASYGIGVQSLDQYMRRSNYMWRETFRDYIRTPKHPLYVPEDKALQVPPRTAKLRRVLSEFEKPGAHAKEVAQKCGFLDARDMASYMEQRGYAWSPEGQTYIRVKARRGDEDDQDERLFNGRNPFGNPEAVCGGAHEAPVLTRASGPQVDWGKYVPLLEMLSENSTKLARVLDQTPNEEMEMPRYLLRGNCRPRSVQMADGLKDLMEEFSRDRNVRQRDVVEVALVDFFRRYGYGVEVDAFLMAT